MAFYLHYVIKKQQRPPLCVIPEDRWKVFLQRCWSHEPEQRPLSSGKQKPAGFDLSLEFLQGQKNFFEEKF